MKAHTHTHKQAHVSPVASCLALPELVKSYCLRDTRGLVASRRDDRGTEAKIKQVAGGGLCK